MRSNRSVVLVLALAASASLSVACSSSKNPAGGTSTGDAAAVTDGSGALQDGSNINVDATSGNLDGATGHPDANSGTPDASGTTGDAGGGTADSGSASGDAAGGSDAASGDGGAETGSACTQYATAYCQQLQTCDNYNFLYMWGDLTTCETWNALSCSGVAPSMVHTGGFANLNGCLALLGSGAGACDSFFETTLHPYGAAAAACRPAPGTIADQSDAGCGYDTQCAGSDVCDFQNANSQEPACFEGTCDLGAGLNSPCTLGNLGECNQAKGGVQCVPSLVGDAGADGSGPASDGTTLCQVVTYGGTGATCVPGTNMDCQSGYFCSVDSTCVKQAGVGVSCTTDSNCDSRLHLKCVTPDGGSQATCAGPTLPVGLGHDCTTDKCQGTGAGLGTLFCNTGAGGTPTCAPRVADGGVCSTTVGNAESQCAYGLTCASSGNCLPPDAGVVNCN